MILRNRRSNYLGVSIFLSDCNETSQERSLGYADVYSRLKIIIIIIVNIFCLFIIIIISISNIIIIIIIKFPKQSLETYFCSF